MAVRLGPNHYPVGAGIDRRRVLPVRGAEAKGGIPPVLASEGGSLTLQVGPLSDVLKPFLNDSMEISRAKRPAFTRAVQKFCLFGEPTVHNTADIRGTLKNFEEFRQCCSLAPSPQQKKLYGLLDEALRVFVGGIKGSGDTEGYQASNGCARSIFSEGKYRELREDFEARDAKRKASLTAIEVFMKRGRMDYTHTFGESVVGAIKTEFYRGALPAETKGGETFLPHYISDLTRAAKHRGFISYAREGLVRADVERNYKSDKDHFITHLARLGDGENTVFLAGCFTDPAGHIMRAGAAIPVGGMGHAFCLRFFKQPGDRFTVSLNNFGLGQVESRPQQIINFRAKEGPVVFDLMPDQLDPFLTSLYKWVGFSSDSSRDFTTSFNEMIRTYYAPSPPTTPVEPDDPRMFLLESSFFSRSLSGGGNNCVPKSMLADMKQALLAHTYANRQGGGDWKVEARKMHRILKYSILKNLKEEAGYCLEVATAIVPHTVETKLEKLGKRILSSPSIPLPPIFADKEVEIIGLEIARLGPVAAPIAPPPKSWWKCC